MDANRSSGRVTSSTGDVDRDGELVGALTDRLHVNGTMLSPARWAERPGFHERIGATGQDPAAIRRMIAGRAS